MRLLVVVFVAAAFCSGSLSADTLGFFEQRFLSINFERGRWERAASQSSCYTYTALERGAAVEVLRYGTSNLVPFVAKKGMKVEVCNSTATFDEGFEAGRPGEGK